VVERQRTRYIGGAEGAPPLPPPGGYAGAARPRGGAEVAASRPETSGITYADPQAGREGGVSPLSLAAISATAIFAVILLLLMLAGGTDALYGVTLLVLQLVVVGLIVAALLTPRGRMLGAIALAVSLVFNVATVGAMGALQSAANQAYDGTKSERQRHEEAYPGVKDHAPQDALNGPTLEEVQAEGDALMAAVRERVSKRFGYTWVRNGTADVSPERNGYGGESMLRRYTSTTWTTEQPVRDDERKRQVMQTISEVLRERGLSTLYPLNEVDTGIAPDMVAKLYGSAEPSRQHTWEYYGDTYPGPLRFYAYAHDLSNDPTGEFRTQREALAQQTGEPLEGIQLIIFARRVLPEADRAEFEQRLQEYPGF